MIERLAVAREDAHRAARFQAGAEEDVLEELLAHVVGARTGEQEAAGGHFPDGCAVEVLVGAKSLIDVLLLFDEGGRVENNEVVVERPFSDERNGVFG